MAFLVEVVGDVGMDRCEFLQGLHSPEPEHRPFSSSKWQMAILHPVVGMSTDLLLVAIAELGHRRAVGFQPVSNDRRRRAVTPQRLLHERECGLFITSFGDEALEELTLVINRALSKQ